MELQIRSLTKDEIALFRGGLELLAIQGGDRTRMLAKSALDQRMYDDLLYVSKRVTE